MEIYCVKIRQRRFPDKTYFPFERLYIVPEEFITSEQWKRVFEHMLVIESPEPVLKMLNKITVDKRSAIAKDGRTLKVTGTWRDSWSPGPTGIPNLAGKRIVIPTYIHRKSLGYTWSYLESAIMHGLEVSLYLPDRIIPSICYLCENLSHKYAGDCTPSTAKCRELIKIDLTTRKEDVSA